MPESDNTTQSKLIAEAVSRVLSDGSVAALATLMESVSDSSVTGMKLLVYESGSSEKPLGSLRDENLNRLVIEQGLRFLESKLETRAFRLKDFAPELTGSPEVQILFERIQPEPRLVICGAGHVGASLAKLATLLGYHTTLIDDRAEFVTPGQFLEPNIELVLAADWTEAVRRSIGNGHAVSVAIVTRGHSEDERCLRAATEFDLDYVGLIGSKRRTNIVLQRLRDSGAAEARLAKVHAPVGLDIGAVTPEEVALAIMAEIVAIRRGGKGGSLSERKRGRDRGEGVRGKG